MPEGTRPEWITESAEPAPTEVAEVDDRMPAKVALRRMKAGEFLLWTGDFHNGRQLLRAVQKRLNLTPRDRATGLAERWREERDATSEKARILGRLIVALEVNGSVRLRRAPDTREAVRWAWGSSSERRLVALRTLNGALGAAGWRRHGMEVAGLDGKITPHYGVFSPTRQVYIELLDSLGEVRGKTLLDVGCGTGVLSFVLFQRGLRSAVGIDIEPRAVLCAQANAAARGLGDRFRVEEADLYGEEQRFDLVLFNAPWMPETPATRLDGAIFDDGGRTLHRWLEGLSTHLLPGGSGLLILSDLPERLGLRPEDELQLRIAEAGLEVVRKHALPAGHGRARNRRDPLHVARAAERIRLFQLQPIQS